MCNGIVERVVSEALICCSNSLQPSLKALEDFGNTAAGICSHSAARALERSAIDVGDQARLEVGVPVHPKGVGRGEDPGSLQVN